MRIRSSIVVSCDKWTECNKAGCPITNIDDVPSIFSNQSFHHQIPQIL